MAKRRSEKAVVDGRLVRAFTRRRLASIHRGKNGITASWPKLYRVKPEEVVAIIKWHVLKTMGEWMRDNSEVTSSHGFFYIRLPYRRPLNAVADNNWRGFFRKGVRLRRHQVGLALRAMHGEELTGN